MAIQLLRLLITDSLLCSLLANSSCCCRFICIVRRSHQSDQVSASTGNRSSRGTGPSSSLAAAAAAADKAITAIIPYQLLLSSRYNAHTSTRHTQLDIRHSEVWTLLHQWINGG